MNLFIDNLMLKKNLSVKQMILIFLLICSLLLTLLFGSLEGYSWSSVSALICAILCYSLIDEVQKLHIKFQQSKFQKNIISDNFDAAIFANFIFSDTGKCVFINRMGQNLFAGFRIRSIEDLIVCFGKHREAVDAINRLNVMLKEKKHGHIDVPMRLKKDDITDTTVWRISAAPLSSQSGYFSWMIVDMTPSIHRIESLDTNANFLFQIIENSSVGYFCIDENNDISLCNKVFEDFFNNSSGAFIGKSIFEYIPRGSDFLKIQHIGSTVRIHISDGNSIIIKQILENPNGVRGFIVHKENQQDGDLLQVLNKTKLYLEHVFEDAPLGIIITDGAEIIDICNRTFKNIIGIDYVDKSSSFLDFVADEKREFVRSTMYDLISGVHESLEPFEIQLKSKDRARSVMVYASKIEEKERTKENDGLVVYFMDITEIKDLQNQFVQSQKMQAVGQLAGGIAHDFNNLLTAMIGYCDLLLEKYMPSDQSFNDIMQIKQNANRASNLVRQLLAFSRQQTLQPKILSVSDMLSELSALLKRLLGAKIELKVHHSRDVGFVKVDQIQFEQIIINLAVNARDAMKGGGVLDIQTSSYSSKDPKLLRNETMPSGEYVLIEIKDNGSGIDQKNLNRVFEPFFSTKEKGSGTGLGLSTVYGIVNQTGGFISVESKVGFGTTFSLYFPRFSESEAEVDHSMDSKSISKPMDLTGTSTILLVEDEDAVRAFSSRALSDKGYRVIEASNGESALEFIKKEGNSIDLIITDVVMPKMDGPTLMEHVKTYQPLMKVIFISGYTEDNFRDSLANDSNVHFLSKPFNLKELAKKVKDVIREEK